MLGAEQICTFYFFIALLWLNQNFFYLDIIREPKIPQQKYLKSFIALVW